MKTSQQIKDWISQGLKLLEENQCKAACSLFQKAIDRSIHAELWELYIDAEIHHFEAAIKEGIKIEKITEREGRLISQVTAIFGKLHKKSIEAHYEVGRYYLRQYTATKALEHLSSAVQIAEQIYPIDSLEFIDLYNNLGRAYSQCGVPMTYIDYIEKAIDLSKKHDLPETSRITLYINLSTAYYYLNDTQQAIEYALLSIRLIKEVKPLDANNLSEVYGNLAMMYQKMMDFERQLFYQKKSLQIAEEHLEATHYSLVSIHNNLGVALFNAQDYSNALHHLEIARRLCIQTYGKDSFVQSFIYSETARVYTRQKKFEKSLEYSKKSIEILEKQGKERYKSLIHDYGNYSLNLTQLGRTEEAIYYIDKALAIAHTNFGERDPNTLNLHMFAAIVFHEKKAYLESLKHINIAISRYFSDFPYSSIYALPPLAEIKNQRTAFVYLVEKCRMFFDYYRYETLSRKDLEATLHHLQYTAKMIDSFRQSYRTEGSKLLMTQIGKVMEVYEKGIAVALLAMGVNEEANSEYAFDFSEKLKAAILASNLQDTQAKTTINIPASLLERERQLKIKLTYLDKTIQRLTAKEEKEPLNSRNLQLLKDSQNQFFDLKQQHIDFVKQLETNYPDYYQLKYDTKTVTPTELQSTLQENQVVLSYFVGEDNLYIFVVTPDEFEVIDLQLPTDFEALVQSFMDALTQHQYAAFVEKSHQLHQLLIAPIRDFLVDDFGFDEDEEELKQVFVIPHGVLSYVPFEALIDSSQPLPKFSTVGKVSSRTENSPTSEGFGENSPFEGGKGDVWSGLDYLLHHCQISYHYSATLLHRHLLKKQTEEELPNSFAGFAPIYDVSIPNIPLTPIDSSNSLQRENKGGTTPPQDQTDILQQSAKSMQAWATRSEAIRSDGTWVSLPHSETEAKGIAQLFAEKGLEGKTFLREKANKEGFAEAAKRFKFLLVAAHGLVNDEQTALSGLVFYPNKVVKNSPLFEKHGDIWNGGERQMSPSPSDVGESTLTDNVLSMEETHHLDLQADLVVLSSCESGIGTLHKGEGMMAVNRGFLAAGTNNVVSTLFKVYDKPSSLLTQYLFEAILGGAEYSAALRLAKLKLMQQPNIDPKSWCGFVLIGG